MPCIFVIIVPWLKVRREGVELLWCVVCYCWMMLPVDRCLNEDPGPLPGPRYICVRSAHYARNALYDVLPPFYRLPTKSDNQNIVQPAIIGILIKAYLFESLHLIVNA